MNRKKYLISIILSIPFLLYSCAESMEERAAREAKDYTRKFCPTPFINNIRTDSITFNERTKTYTYYCTFGNILDNPEIIEANRSKIEKILMASIQESTSMKPYIEAGFHFKYICRSEKNSDKTLIETAIQ